MILAKKNKTVYTLKCPNCDGTGYTTLGNKLMEADIPCSFKPCERGFIEVLAKSKKQAEELCYLIYDKWKHSKNFEPDKNIFKDWVNHI